MAAALAFLFDVDNTLIDNDRVKQDMEGLTRDRFGSERSDVFWQIYERVRDELGFVDVPRTLERYSERFPDQPRFADLAGEFLCFPYRDYLFPGALEAIRAAAALGRVAIVSDGDRVFQAAKIGRAGLAAAVDHHVMVFTHKDQEFDQVERELPAQRYVLVDDKPQILSTLKARLGERLVTVQVRQGKYAQEAGPTDPDLELASIGEFIRLQPDSFTAGLE